MGTRELPQEGTLQTMRRLTEPHPPRYFVTRVEQDRDCPHRQGPCQLGCMYIYQATDLKVRLLALKPDVY